MEAASLPHLTLAGETSAATADQQLPQTSYVPPEAASGAMLFHVVMATSAWMHSCTYI